MVKNKKVSWRFVENMVASRMIDSSLVHQLVPSRKLRKRTKTLNNFLHRHGIIKNYAEYVKIKTSILRHFSDDSDTEDEARLMDDDYASIFKCDVSLQQYVDKVTRHYMDLPLEEVIEDKANDGRKSVDRIKTKKQQHAVRKKRANVSMNIGWRQVIKQRIRASPKKNRNSAPASLAYEYIPLPAVLQEARSPSSSSVYSNKENINYDEDKESNESKTQDFQLKVEEDDEDTFSDGTTLKRISKISESEVNADTEALTAKKNICKSEKRKSNNQQGGELQRSKDRVKRNLASILQMFNPVINTSYSPNDNSKLQKEQNNNTSELRLSHLHPVDQSTPMSMKKKNKRKLSNKIIYTVVHPKDSGIDDDSQEESSGDGHPSSKTSEPAVKTPTKADNVALEIKKTVEHSPHPGSSRLSDETERIDSATTLQRSNITLDLEETVKYSVNTEQPLPINSPQSSPMKQLTDLNVHDEHDTESKQKLPPKVTCTEIVNKRYKIIPEQQCEEVEQQIECLNDSEVSGAIPAEPDNDLTVLVEYRSHVEDVQNLSESDEDNEDEYRMSAVSQKRLQQLKRLNLIVDSDFSSSDDETHNVRETFIKPVSKSIEKNKGTDCCTTAKSASDNKECKMSRSIFSEDENEDICRNANFGGTENDKKVSESNLNLLCEENQKNMNDCIKMTQEKVNTSIETGEHTDVHEKKKAAKGNKKCKMSKSIFSEDDGEHVAGNTNSDGTENDKKVFQSNLNLLCEDSQKNTDDCIKLTQEKVNTSIEIDEHTDVHEKKKAAKSNKKRKISKSIFSESDSENVGGNTNSDGIENDKKVSKSNLNLLCEENQNNMNDCMKKSQEEVNTSIETDEHTNFYEKKKAAKGNKKRKMSKSIFLEDDAEHVDGNRNCDGTENDKKVSESNLNLLCEENQKDTDDCIKMSQEEVNTSIEIDEHTNFYEKKKAAKGNKKRKILKSIFSESDSESVGGNTNSGEVKNAKKVFESNLNLPCEENEKNVNDCIKVSQEEVDTSIKEDGDIDINKKRKTVKGNKECKTSKLIFSESDTQDSDQHTHSGIIENDREGLNINSSLSRKEDQKNVSNHKKISEPVETQSKKKSSQPEITSSDDRDMLIEEPCSPSSTTSTSKRTRTASGLFNIALDIPNDISKEATPKKTGKEGIAKDKSVIKSASKSKTKDAGILPNGRPMHLQDLVNEQELTEYTDFPSFTLTDLSDEDIYILDVPSTALKNDLRGKRLLLKKKRLTLGDERYKISQRDKDALTFVMYTGKSPAMYKAVNIIPTGSAVVRERLQLCSSTEFLNTSDSKENTEKNVLEIKKQELKVDSDEDTKKHRKEKRKETPKRNSMSRTVKADSPFASDMVTPKKKKLKSLKTPDTESDGGTPKSSKSGLPGNTNRDSDGSALKRKRSSITKNQDSQSGLETPKIKKINAAKYYDTESIKKDFTEKRFISLRHYDTDSE